MLSIHDLLHLPEHQTHDLSEANGGVRFDRDLRTRAERTQTRPFDNQLPIRVEVIRDTNRFLGYVDLDEVRSHMSTGIVAAPRNVRPRRYRGPVGRVRGLLAACLTLMAEAEQTNARNLK